MDFFDFQKKLMDEQKAATAKPAGKPTPVADALTVSQLTSQIERALQGAFPGSVRVLGEVSNFKAHSSGHLYFTLKDASACINCVMFRSDAARLKFSPEDGMELIATGRISLYAQRGQYQLYITRLEPVGLGALQMAFQQLHDKLKAQGLFEPERKKPIPAYPTTTCSRCCGGSRSCGWSYTTSPCRATERPRRSRRPSPISAGSTRPSAAST
jgi:hypothetical protein